MIKIIRHAFALIREDKLFSAIYVAGTAVAIASAMVIAIVFNMLLADIPPEVNRSRTLYVSNRFIPGEKSDDVPYHQGLSSMALDSCYRRMKCVEAATGIIPAYQNNYTIESEAQLGQGQYEAPRVSAIATDHDFFRFYDLDFIDGRPFSKKESDEGERVCVVTDKVAERTGTSTGATVRVNGKPFRVVGVVKAVSAFLEDATADIYLPYMVEGMDLYPNNRNPLRNGDNYVDVTYEGNLSVRILLREGYALKDFNAELEPLRQQYSAHALLPPDQFLQARRSRRPGASIGDHEPDAARHPHVAVPLPARHQLKRLGQQPHGGPSRRDGHPQGLRCQAAHALE